MTDATPSTDEAAPGVDLFPLAEPGDEPRPAVLILPGGGYRRISMTEAEPVARWVNSLGLHAAFARYPVAPRRHPEPSRFASGLLSRMKSEASPLPNDPDRVAVLGFSAGGHLAATLATSGEPRPDLCILSYPVVSFVADVHEGSRASLLGADPAEALTIRLSAELQVDARTPPTFIWHTAADPTVPVANTLRYTEALWRAGIDVECHVFDRGGHGLSLARGESSGLLGAAQWPELCRAWLGRQGWL
jgi:acetyl esterase/lipase